MASNGEDGDATNRYLLETAFNNVKVALENDKATLENSKTALENNKVALENTKADFKVMKVLLENSLENNKASIESNKAALEANKTALEANKTALEANKTALEASKAALKGRDTTMIEAGGGPTATIKTESSGSTDEMVALVPGKKRKAEVEECMTCKGKSCGLCKSKGHTLEHCLLTENGFIKGCVLCNTTSHNVDRCAKFTGLSMDAKLNLLVNERAGLPPLSTVKSWSNMMLAWLHDNESRGKEAPVGYPWSNLHASIVSGGVYGRLNYKLQSRFDRSGHDRSILPKYKWHEDAVAVWRFHWKTMGVPFPQRLIEMGFPRPSDDVQRDF
ncbi:hypothetical protein ACHAPO_002138 [Fusarium lateritium]